MAKYNKEKVPILSFYNPAANTLYPDGLYSYAIGNTRGKSLLENFGTKKDQPLDVLLIGSGDVRNVLFTLGELLLRKTDNRPKNICFHINDYDPLVVARNLVILEVIDTINPGIPSDIDFLWNVWYNIALSKSHHDRLRQVLVSLLKNNFNSDNSLVKFRSSNVFQELRSIWEDWRDLDRNVEDTKKERKALIDERGYDFSKFFFGVYLGIQMANSDLDDLHGSFSQELEHWYLEGSTNDEMAHLNPTLICPIVHKWAIHYSACPFVGYLPIEREAILSCGSLTEACKEILKILVKQFQRIRLQSILEITPWTGDGVGQCTSGFPENLIFDIIDTSNVSDHIGLLNVLVCCCTRLKKPLESQLLTSSMNWQNLCKNVEDYYNKSIGVDPFLLPTLLRLKLAEDFDLGSRTLPQSRHLNDETFCWIRIEQPKTLINIDETSDIVHALQILTERCFNHKHEFLDRMHMSHAQTFGINMPSPITLLRIVDQLDPLIAGGATRILELLHGRLPSSFDKQFGLSWNLIKASTGTNQQPIVEVSVQIKFSSQSGETPIPMIIILDDESNTMEYNLWGKPTHPVIYNSLRYDNNRHILTFHLVKNDWNMIKEKTWLTIVSSDLSRFIYSETVFLGNNVVINEVDAVETFGLFSRQILKIIKVEESKYFYTAELEITNPTKCKAKDMRIIFDPENCPTSVNVGFADANGCTLNFSCAINEKASKFQISKKQGKITCEIPKRQNGTVGERVLQNPAPIPFHALFLWDTKLLPIRRACSQMTRTVEDVRLKIQKSGGDAFFDLKESITIIFNKYFDSEMALVFFHLADLPPGICPTEVWKTIFEKQSLVIKVEKIYKWKHSPVAKVIFFEYKCGDDWKTEGELYWSLKSSQVIPIPSSIQEQNLFRKMLDVNAVRTGQEGLSGSVWIRSFICTVFCRGNCQDVFDQAFRKNLFSNSSADVRKGNCGFCQRSAEKLTRCMGCKKVSYCGKDCQKLHWKTGHKNECKNVDVNNSSSNSSVDQAKCCFCEFRSENLMKCSRCKKMFYCSKNCQKSHWKLEHKGQCQNA